MKNVCKYIFVGLLGCLLMSACQHEGLPPATEVMIDSLAIVPAYVLCIPVGFADF